MSDPELNSWASEYRATLSTYESCASKLESLIRELLESEEIDVVAIEARAKHPDSLQRKVDAKRESYESPLADVTDLIGVRVITYYLEDVERINEIIEREFVIDEEHSSDKLADMEPDRFGYRSVHFIVTLSDRRANLAEWSVFGGRKAEIQVRTATQHAWAAVEHKLNYKRASEAPRDLRRRLLRLSALFELADEQFSVVKDELEAVEARYSSDLEGGNLELPIDTASLEAFIDGNALIDELAQRSADRGFPLAVPDLKYRTEFEQDLRDLVKVLDALGVETIAEFDVIVRRLAEQPGGIEEVADNFQPAFSLWRSPADLLTLFVGFQMGVAAEVFEAMYKPSVVRRMRELRGEELQPG
jgi:putative GTP pyrophosphokinase